ncbi:subunit A of DNA gyrase/topoisomerase IV, partial [Helicosporidium sp. ATCC 50920]
MSENASLNTALSQAKPSKASKPASKKKTIEQTYQKLTQLEHVLLRPDTYIGSCQRQSALLWIHDGEGLQHKTVEVSPGLYKIFDEILVNAADNKVRDHTMDTLRIDVDEVTGSIRVLNNGAGVPVEIHKEHGIYVPELIFGNLLTSSNYDDGERKMTGGRNGYGAKLANIFSVSFVVETCDGARRKRYKQTFSTNMTHKGEPRITDCPAGENWTSITFVPEYSRFGMESLDADTVSLFRRRAYDMAGVLGKTVNVYYNGKKLAVRDFAQYVDMYLGPKDSGPPRFYERVNERWEVVVSVSDGQFEQVSFVNSIATAKGGTHVNLVEGQLTKHILEHMTKKHKQAATKAHMVKSYLWVFVNCLIENPAFDSQAKETLTLQASAFGSKCALSEALLKRVAGCGIVEGILSLANAKAARELKKGDGAKRSRVLGIPKLDDANDAGGRNSSECTLILTEGDSAKTLAVAGLSVVGRDRYGVFPLRGKLLNVRDASAAQISGNAEIQNIKQILGLQHGKEYNNSGTLRYGHLMIMTDQDHDGSHIKGLIMNYLHTFYPSLLKLPGFLVEFVTPIIKATKGREQISFYTVPEYEAWCEERDRRGWSVKYYKGLGTSTAAEAKTYFAALERHRKEFVWHGQEDGQALEMAFSKKKVEERKEWLRAFVPGTFLDHAATRIAYSDFVNRELILFSRADLERSIPSAVDGLKPGQRKILFACFKRNLKKDIKVAQLAGYVAEKSAYHHGETSLMGTIVGLAQDFVGSNNVNYLVPQGQFGTRLQGGKDAASARYIFTRLAAVARRLFPAADDVLLRNLAEEGQVIEPEWYVPILPTVLLNGAEGIGTGWSTFIPNHNPRDVVDNVRRLLDGQPMEPMAPWYRGFRGTIEE